jgi:hypothetical protein
MLLNQKDYESYLQFRKIVKGAKYELQGEVAIQVALLFRWFDELEKVFKYSVEEINKKETAAKKKKAGKKSLQKIGE